MDNIGLRLIGIVFIASLFIARGVYLLRQSLSSDQIYDLRQDIKLNFFTLHWKYSSRHLEGKNTRIAPIMLIICGTGIIVIGFIKILFVN